MSDLKKLKLNELGRVKEQEYSGLDKLPVIVVLYNLRSSHNVGSVFRTTDGFTFSKVITTGVSPTPPNKDITKTALGAERTVDHEHFSDEAILEEITRLKEEGYTVLGIEQTNQSIDLRDLNQHNFEKIVYILGNEVKGVKLELLQLCDHCVEIPMTGSKHSFNVSVCNGIIGWEVRKQMVSL